MIAALVTQGVLVVVSLVVAFGWDATGDQIAAISGAAGFLGLLAWLWAWAKTVGKEQVLERLVGPDTVVAGPANDLVHEGEVIRRLGDPEGL